MKIFLNALFNNLFFSKKFPVKEFSASTMVVRELLRRSDCFKNLSIGRSDISRIQLKSKWTVDE